MWPLAMMRFLIVAVTPEPMVKIEKLLEEVVGFARAMRRHAAPVFPEGQDRPRNMVDTCGTGGDRAKMFNVSTAAAIVAAAAGARVAKHGNRRSDGVGSGSADVFQAGAFARHNFGPAYLSGALAYGWHDVTTILCQGSR